MREFTLAKEQFQSGEAKEQEEARYCFSSELEKLDTKEKEKHLDALGLEEKFRESADHFFNVAKISRTELGLVDDIAILVNERERFVRELEELDDYCRIYSKIIPENFTHPYYDKARFYGLEAVRNLDKEINLRAIK